MLTKRTPTKGNKGAKLKPITPTSVVTRSNSPAMSIPLVTAAAAAAATAAAPTMSADMLAYIQMRKEERAEERADKIAQERRHEKQIDLMQRQCDATIAAFTSKHNERAKPPTTKLPIFDLEQDSENFTLWKSRWDIHIQAHRIHLITDDDEKDNRLLLELYSGLSDNTQRWLQNRNFESAELKDDNFLITALQAHIKSKSNPMVRHVEMGHIQRHENETADHFYQRINSQADKCEFESIKNFKNHTCLLTLLRGVSPELRRKMLLAKVTTYEEAVEIMRAQENATRDSQQCSTTTYQEASANRVSAYKHDQKQRYANSNSSPNKDSQSSSRPFRCIRCHSTEHLAHRCPALLENKICNKCQTPGHLAHACLRESRERRHSFSDERSRPTPHVSFAPTTTKASANTVYASTNQFSAYDSENDTLYGRDREYVECLVEADILQQSGGMLR